MSPKIPFLVESDSVRSEAMEQYGNLSDAAAFHQAWRAQIDPNLEATALKRLNEEETERVRASLAGDGKLVASKIEDYLDESLDEMKLSVLDAVVRGEGLSIVAETADGRYVKFVVPYTSKWQSVGISQAEAAARKNALETVDVARLQKEMQAELNRRLAEQRAEIIAEIRGEMAAGRSSSPSIDAVLAGEHHDDDTEGEGSEEETEAEDGDDVTVPEGEYPRRNDKLDKLAAEADPPVVFEPNAKIGDKIEALQKAGVKP